MPDSAPLSPQCSSAGSSTRSDRAAVSSSSATSEGVLLPGHVIPGADLAHSAVEEARRSWRLQRDTAGRGEATGRRSGRQLGRRGGGGLHKWRPQRRGEADASTRRRRVARHRLQPADCGCWSGSRLRDRQGRLVAIRVARHRLQPADCGCWRRSRLRHRGGRWAARQPQSSRAATGRLAGMLKPTNGIMRQDRNLSLRDKSHLCMVDGPNPDAHCEWPREFGCENVSAALTSEINEGHSVACVSVPGSSCCEQKN